jgi:hypothetical protein
MHASHNTTDSPGDGDEVLGLQEAANLLERTQRQAQHQFSTARPLLSLVNALIILVIYGAIWLSTRGQNPYRGPSLSTIGLVYLLVAITIPAGVAVYVRATTGVKGRSRQEDRRAVIPLIAAIIGVYAFDGALKYDGFSNAIVYGVFDAAAPWLVVGALLAGIAATRQDWWSLAAAVAVIAIGVGSAFAGPINAWGVLAVGGCLLLLAQTALRLRRSPHV